MSQSPRKQKRCLDKSKRKVMLVVFFDWKGIVHFEFISQGCTCTRTIPSPWVHNLRPISGKTSIIRRFESSKEKKAASEVPLREISENGFLECYQQWFGRWRKCVLWRLHNVYVFTVSIIKDIYKGCFIFDSTVYGRYAAVHNAIARTTRNCPN